MLITRVSLESLPVAMIFGISTARWFLYSPVPRLASVPVCHTFWAWWSGAETVLVWEIIAGNFHVGLRNRFRRGFHQETVANMSIAVQPPHSPSIFLSSSRQELSQQVPGSPYLGRAHSNKTLTTKPAHSPVARVPEIGSPLLRRLLKGTRVRATRCSSNFRLTFHRTKAAIFLSAPT